jgi:hypothetical protein
VLPGDPEHALLIIFPNQPWIHAAVNLLNQPLSKPPSTIPVAHPWKEENKSYDTTRQMSLRESEQPCEAGTGQVHSKGAGLGESPRPRESGPPAR